MYAAIIASELPFGVAIHMNKEPGDPVVEISNTELPEFMVNRAEALYNKIVAEREEGSSDKQRMKSRHRHHQFGYFFVNEEENTGPNLISWRGRPRHLTSPIKEPEHKAIWYAIIASMSPFGVTLRHHQESQNPVFPIYEEENLSGEVRSRVETIVSRALEVDDHGPDPIVFFS